MIDPTTRNRAARLLGPAALLLLAVPACGPGQFHHDVYPAGGVVTYRGEPVDNATVVFHPADPAALVIPEGEQGPRIGNPTVQTGPDGQFTLSTYYADDGAPAGAYKVTVLWAPQVLAVSIGEESDDETDPRTARVRRRKADKLKGRYADPSTTPLEATIVPGGDNQFTLDLG